MDTGQLLRHATQQLGAGADRPALSFEDLRTWSYAELQAYANRCANVLLRFGVQPGDRVGLMMHNALEYVGAYFGITRIGAIAVRLNWRLAAEELTYAIEDSGCSVLLVHDGLAAGLAPVRDGLGVRAYLGIRYDDTPTPPWLLGAELIQRASAAEPPIEYPRSDDRAMIMYTSGTTGYPKGAVWTHGGTVGCAVTQEIAFGYTADTVAMTTGPLFHVGSFEDLILATLAAGGHGVITRSRNFDITRVASTIESMGVTDVLTQPTMLYQLLGVPDLTPARLRSLRRIYTGGTDIHEWAMQRLALDLPSVEVMQLYGLTEGGAISTLHRVTERDPPGNIVGRPLPLNEVRISREDGTQAPTGEIGEIWVRGPGSSLEYWDKPEASAETFRGGWCRTGDVGRIDDGALFVTGRKKDMIKSGGENIYPVEVENVIMRHPSVLEAAVIGVADATYTETVCAVIVTRDGATVGADEIVAYCRQHLASYKKPRHVVFVDELPRSYTGKVKKQKLRTTYRDIGCPGLEVSTVPPPPPVT